MKKICLDLPQYKLSSPMSLVRFGTWYEAMVLASKVKFSSNVLLLYNKQTIMLEM